MSTNSANKERALKQLAAYDFAQTELNLFLDTHPNNQKALKDFQKISKKAKELREYFENEFGPLTIDSVTDTDEWTWVKSPWPWEN